MVLWILQMAAAFWFCTQKQGFHEDEFYTYYSTARTNGFYVEDGKWMERDAYRNEFVVLPEERFQYGLVKQVQSWDVHPPMYYWVFHTAASLVPGVFSKWIGLSVNLLFHGINLILLTYLSYLAAGRDKDLPFFVTFVYGFSPAAMSGVVFLTQYYYFIFLFFLAAAFCVWLLWRDRGIGNCLRYGFFQVLAFVLAYLTYPAFPGQMFKGQRGAQATENFFDLSNTFERIGFFWDLMNRYVFGGLLGLIILLFGVVALAGCMMKASQRKRAHTQTSEKTGSGQCGERQVFSGVSFYMLFFTAAGYFLAVSKTALLLGDTSNRYQIPIYGIAVLLLLLGAAFLLRRFFRKWDVAVFCVAVVALGYVQAGVVFLYPEAEEGVALAREQAAAQIPAVYVYKPGEEWCIWAVADELMEYDRVYFVSAAGGEPVKEPSIEAADAVVAYLPLYDDGKEEEAQRLRITSGNGELAESHLQHSHKYCTEWYYGGDGDAWSGTGDLRE